MLTPIPIFVCVVSHYSSLVQYLAVGMFNPLLNFTFCDGHRIGISNFYGNWGIGCFLCTRLIPYASVSILSDPITQCINYKSVLNEKEDYVRPVWYSKLPELYKSCNDWRLRYADSTIAFARIPPAPSCGGSILHTYKIRDGSQRMRSWLSAFRWMNSSKTCVRTFFTLSTPRVPLN